MDKDQAETATRTAVRVLLLDERSRVLLFQGRDTSGPSGITEWWFTAGGGVDGDESLVETAHREVEEETGLRELHIVDVHHRREVDFWSHGVEFRQVEHFVAARTTRTALVTDGWTDLERRTVIAWRWWSVDDLETTKAVYFPENLPELVRRAATLV